MMGRVDGRKEAAHSHRARAVIALALAGFPAAACAQTYSVTDIGTLATGNESIAYGINELGQVVGWSRITSNGNRHAFRWTSGAMLDLGTLGTGNESYAYGINDSGVVVGRSLTSGIMGNRAFRYNGTLTDLNTVSAGISATASEAWGINSTGQITGVNNNTGVNARAYRLTGTTLADLGSMPSSPGLISFGAGINNAGNVVGYAAVNSLNNIAHAFRWTGSGSIIDMGTLGGTQSWAHDINTSGQITGGAEILGDTEHAFRWSGGSYTDLGVLAGPQAEGWGINDSGVIVGFGTYTAIAGLYHAFVAPGNSVTDLNQLIDPGTGWVLTEARDINNAGQIVGRGTINGQTHAFLTAVMPAWVNPAGGTWLTTSNWSPAAVPSASSDTRFNLNSVAGYTVSVTAPQSVNRIYIQTDKLTLNLNANTLTVTNSLNVAALAGQNGQLTLSNGTVSAANVYVGGNALAAGGTGVLTINSSATLKTTGALKVWNTAGSQIDVKNGKIIAVGGDVGSWNGTDYTGITGIIKAGRNGGAWNGNGIRTSMTDAAGNHLTTLAIATAGETGISSFGGISVSGSDVLVKYTYSGDANLSGQIDGDDFAQIDTGYSGGLHGFFNGDFDYSGTVDADDYFLIDAAYVRQSTPFLNGQIVEGIAAVPEPASAGAILGIGAMLAARRNRRRSPL